MHSGQVQRIVGKPVKAAVPTPVALLSAPFREHEPRLVDQVTQALSALPSNQARYLSSYELYVVRRPLRMSFAVLR